MSRTQRPSRTVPSRGTAHPPIGPPPRTPETRLHRLPQPHGGFWTRGSGSSVCCGVSVVLFVIRHSHCTAFRDLSSCRDSESAGPSLGTPQTTHRSGSPSRSSHLAYPCHPSLGDRPPIALPAAGDFSSSEEIVEITSNVFCRSRLLRPYAMSRPYQVFGQPPASSHFNPS